MNLEEENLRAFHGDAAIKQKYVDRLQAHRAAENLIQGDGWDDESGKGCAVGCTLEDYDHAIAHAADMKQAMDRCERAAK